MFRSEQGHSSKQRSPHSLSHFPHFPWLFRPPPAHYWETCCLFSLAILRRDKFNKFSWKTTPGIALHFSMHIYVYAHHNKTTLMCMCKVWMGGVCGVPAAAGCAWQTHRHCQMCDLQAYAREWPFVTKQNSHLCREDLFRAFSTSMSSLL